MKCGTCGRPDEVIRLVLKFKLNNMPLNGFAYICKYCLRAALKGDKDAEICRELSFPDDMQVTMKYKIKGK